MDEYLQREQTTEHWFTADWLLDDVESFRERGQPFGSLSDYRAALLERLNAVVRRHDVIWVLGNVLRDAANVASVLLPFTARIRGRVRLVAGRYDSCFAGYGDNDVNRHELQRQTARYQAAGIDSVLVGARVRRVGFGMLSQVLTPRNDAGNREMIDVELTSLPSIRRADAPTQLDDYRPRPLSGVDRRPTTKRWVITNGEESKWLTWGRNVNVAVDVWDYQPVHNETLARLLRSRERQFGAQLDDETVRVSELGDVDPSPPQRVHRRRTV